MLDKLIEQAKSQLVPALMNDPEVDNAQADQIAQVSGETVVNSLSEQLDGGDLSGIQEMLSGQDTDQANPSVNNLTPKVAENLGSRLGLSPEMSQGIAAKVVPLIMNMLNGKVQNAQSSGLDIGGILGGLTGGGSQGGGGGLMGKLGGLFGGKNEEGQASGGSAKGVVSDLLGNILGR